MEPKKDNLVHSLDEKKTPTGAKATFSMAPFLIILVIAVLLGLGAGLLASYKKPATPGQQLIQVGTQKTAGVKDTKQFPDKAEGVLREGGIDGEGNFHLERPGGDSQNVYLTSSSVDLSKFVGKKIRVWGQTFEGQKAGWLMDVGYVESL